MYVYKYNVIINYVMFNYNNNKYVKHTYVFLTIFNILFTVV